MNTANADTSITPLPAPTPEERLAAAIVPGWTPEALAALNTERPTLDLRDIAERQRVADEAQAALSPSTPPAEKVHSYLALENVLDLPGNKTMVFAVHRIESIADVISLCRPHLGVGIRKLTAVLVQLLGIPAPDAHVAWEFRPDPQQFTLRATAAARGRVAVFFAFGDTVPATPQK